MESREMVLMSPLQGGSGDAGVQVGLVDTGRAGRGTNGDRSISTHAVRRETASGREGPVAQGPSPVLWDDGEGCGWEAPEGGEIRTCTGGPLCRTAEISTTL